MADVLVLGADGTLGHVAARVLARRFDTIVTARRASETALGFDATDGDPELRALLARVRPGGMVLNAVAVLATDASEQARERVLAVNAVFPHRLARIAQERDLRVVHISTDAVFPHDAGECRETDRIGPEDLYGLSKAEGEISGPNTVTIRCSLIGPPAAARARGLWAWIASEGKGATIRGYVNQIWGGVTTLQLAHVCAALVDGATFERAREHGPIHHLAPNRPLSKFELVRTLAAILRPDLSVVEARGPVDVTRVLASRYQTLDRLSPHYSDWKDAIAASAHECIRQHEVC